MGLDSVDRVARRRIGPDRDTRDATGGTHPGERHEQSRRHPYATARATKCREQSSALRGSRWHVDRQRHAVGIVVPADAQSASRPLAHPGLARPGARGSQAACRRAGAARRQRTPLSPRGARVSRGAERLGPTHRAGDRQRRAARRGHRRSPRAVRRGVRQRWERKRQGGRQAARDPRPRGRGPLRVPGRLGGRSRDLACQRRCNAGRARCQDGSRSRATRRAHSHPARAARPGHPSRPRAAPRSVGEERPAVRTTRAGSGVR